MDNTTTTSTTGNNETRSSGLGFTRLMLGRSFDSSGITVDKSVVSSSSTSSTRSTVKEASSSPIGGPLTRTLHQLGRLFNSGITSVSASVGPQGGLTSSTAARRESRDKGESRDMLSPMDETFSRRGSFGRTYSFTRCASFSRTNSFTRPSQSS